MSRTVTITHDGREHTYEVGDCDCGRTSVRYYADGRCFWCSTGRTLVRPPHPPSAYHLAHAPVNHRRQA